jgi:hypothetical protein
VIKFPEQRRLAGLLLCVVLGACAGRTPAPVAVVQERDQNADCASITAEIHSNTQQIAALGEEDGAKVAQNIAAGVAGLIIWPLWFAMDFQNASGKEGAALSQRNQYLSQIAARRCSGAGS